ncbi:MAG: hypothetical protein AAFV87_04600 [Pseudomonadota bacterium]
MKTKTAAFVLPRSAMVDEGEHQNDPWQENEQNKTIQPTTLEIATAMLAAGTSNPVLTPSDFAAIISHIRKAPEQDALYGRIDKVRHSLPHQTKGGHISIDLAEADPNSRRGGWIQGLMQKDLIL